MQIFSSKVFSQNTIPTNSGLVRGVLEDGIEKFKGIPYAASPVGENRFQAPKSPTPWSGIFEANKEGASAPQYIDKLGKLQLDKIVGTGWDKGDNFLTLNIWKPIEAKKLPVMVWIHGGAFTLGKKNADAYDGTNFAKSGVICVNINYRLGVEGFVTIPGGTTNNGVRDMLFALKWVQQNISAFGGDQNNVTIFGESAGGTAVSVLVASPLSKGLFQKAIAQSGSVYNIGSLESSKKVTDKLAKNLKIEPSLNGFRSKTFEENLKAQKKIDIGAIFIAYGDDVLPELPMELFKKGAGKDINFLVTSCEDEANIFTVPKKLLWLPSFVAKNALASTMPKAVAKQIYNEYKTDGGSGGRVLSKILTDINFRSPSRLVAAIHQGQTHFLEFDWKSNALNGKLGAAHAIDIPFVFNTTAIVQGESEILGTNDASKEGAYFHKMWVDFAKSGVLNWEEYTDENKNVFYQSLKIAKKEMDLKATKYLRITK